jgi:hypothetical protein
MELIDIDLLQHGPCRSLASGTLLAHSERFSRFKLLQALRKNKALARDARAHIAYDKFLKLRETGYFLAHSERFVLMSMLRAVLHNMTASGIDKISHLSRR